MLNRAPKATRDIWTKLGISPRGIDREVVDCMHRVQMGVGADYTGDAPAGSSLQPLGRVGRVDDGDRYFRCAVRYTDHKKLNNESCGHESRPCEYLGPWP